MPLDIGPAEPVASSDAAAAATHHRVRISGKAISAMVLSMAVLAVVIAVDVYPIITNDSLAYLGHSNSIGPTGFVQAGYRQVGYPAFLALVDAVATAFRMEPLLLTVLIQRLIYLGALGFGVWVWRWRALPLVLFAVIPSLAVYTNFILTEGLAVGLALWYAVLTSWVIRLAATPTGDADSVRSGSRMIMAGASVGAIFVLLVTIRFQYVLLVFGLSAVLFVMHRVGKEARTASYVVGASVLLLVSSFLVMTSRENAEEYGAFFPSVRGERSQFWAAWQVIFVVKPENRSQVELADLYADGNPYNIMGEIDSLPSYAQQQVQYDEVMDRLLVAADTSWWNERTAAFLGVLQGGRIDDVRSIVYSASRSNFWNVEASMYRAAPIRTEGVKYFVDRFNDGRRIEPLLVSALAPVRTFPYFVAIYSWLLLVALAVLIGGMLFAQARLVALVGIATALVTAVVFGYFLMDNVRFVLVPLLFVLGASTGAADSMWRQFQVHRASAAGPG